MPHKKLEIYTDGGARGNPGPAGIGVVIWNGNTLVGTYSKYIGEATNNQAEYEAVLLGLQQAKRLKAEELDFYMDSELAVNQLHHIPREKNKEADKLVNQVIDNHQ